MSGRNVPEGRAKDAQGGGQNPRAWPAHGRATLQVASVVVAISLAVFALSHLAPVRLTGVHLAPAGAEGVSRRKSVAGSISGLDDGATISARALTKRTPGREAASADISGGRPAPAQCSAACSSRATEVVHHVPYVGVCLAVKGDHSKIREWVEYHVGIGVGRIYLYDDDSSPPLKALLQEYIEAGVVDYLSLGGAVRQEFLNLNSVFIDCVKRHADNHHWLGIWDSDEFMIIRDGSPDLPTVLRRYEAYGGLGVNWRMFGSSGHKTRPRKGVLRSYTTCNPMGSPGNVHVKSLANTRHLRSANGPHGFNYQEGYFAVNTKYVGFEGPFSSPPVDDVLVLNHYSVQSEEDFKIKSDRGDGMNGRKSEPFFDAIEAEATETCTYAVSLGKEVAKRLRRRSWRGWNMGEASAVTLEVQ